MSYTGVSHNVACACNWCCSHKMTVKIIFRSFTCTQSWQWMAF